MSERSQQRQRDILAAALQCFAQHGIEATTIDMIREASGASVGSLYHRFGNKEGIAAAVYLAGLADFRRQLETQLMPVSHIKEAIQVMVSTNIQWISANPDWARFLFHHRGVLTQAAQEQAFQQQERAANSQLFNRLASLQGVEKLNPWPPEVFASLVIGPVHEYARHWLAGRRHNSLVELQTIFVEAAWRSLGVV